ncbi:hypothetical protein CALCODRAFT_553559 [Calocera cornea HHB12733]|uniref:P-loop containing nucleoside triphosphate hydrolase protein n=1 Tax=Calocera cornea HHB12733 TaxID=1353952 RepID=A0A165IJ78_9BASI|nr:hypothetical protein CALCODRAFT_553559 [Calocera cornea HHB12733]
MSQLDTLEDFLAQLFQSGVPTSTNAACSSTAIALDPRLIPAYASIVSLLLLIIAASHARVKPRSVPVALSAPVSEPLLKRASDFVEARGGWVIYAFNSARLLGAGALVGLSIAAVVLSGQPREEVVSGTAQIPLGGGQEWDWTWECTGKAEVAILIAHIYATLLSILALVLKGRFRTSCSFHASWIFFIQFLIFLWRNILPLTTFTGVPADGTIPWLLWTRGSFVTLVGVALPAFMPRLYIPYDPANPAPNPAPEQTASIFSFLFFFFLEPIILAAWRIPQLPYDELPPLPDSDWSDNLRARAMDALDPVRRRAMGKKPRHLFWGLMDVFRWEYTKMSCYLLIQCLCRFLGAIGINRLLTFMEHNGTDATIRPWVWILFIFLAPTLKSLLFNMYIFTSTRMMVRAENILTQVIFEHALRVRLTDDSMISASPVPTSGTATANRSDEQSTSTPGTLRTETPTLVETNTSDGGNIATASTAPSSPENNKGKDKKTASAPASKAMHLSAKINSMFGTDIGNLIDGRDFLFLIFDTPLEAILCIFFLWFLLSWAAIVGIVFMMITLPVPGMIAGKIQTVQRKLMQKTDQRVQVITESLGVVRMIKMFGWEGLVKSQVRAVRDEELHYLRLRWLLGMSIDALTALLQMSTMIITFAIYTLVLKQDLDAARVFSSIPIFVTLRHDLDSFVRWITNIIEAKVSLDRVSNFLHSSRLLDKYHRTPVQDAIVTPLAAESDTVGFHNATFTWSDPNSDGPQPGQRHFRLHIEDLTFKNGIINLIVGPTGCGKTSILMALLGEMHFQAEGIDSWFSLPRVRGVAYAAQESWVQNDTIRSNILFGSPFDEVRYQKVLYQCGLVPDLAMFTAGDLTEVGERGLTLSGGQKARITLARAVYSPARILLLDDVVSALDVHTARWVVEKCLQGDLIKDRTVLLVTHAVALIAPIASNVISLGMQGRLISQGPLSNTLLSDPSLREELEENNQILEFGETASGIGPSPTQDKSADGKLVMEEEMAEGRVKWASIKLFMDAVGGPMYWVSLMFGYVICVALSIGGTWWLGHWAQAYEVQQGGGVDVLYYLFVFIGIALLQESVGLLVQVINALLSVRASRRIHDALCGSVLRSTLRWIDSTPVGRIVSRFTQDIREIDGNLTPAVLYFLQMTTSMIMEFVVVIAVSPVFSIPGAVILITGVALGQIYLAAQMCVKRLQSNWRSPLYNHFAAAITGLISVRAYEAEESFKTELRQRADAYSRPSRTFYNLNRWISTRADLLGAMFSAGLATYLLYMRCGVGASTTGFSLTMAVEFSSRILDWVRTINDIEITFNSVERIRDYLTIDHEPEASERGKPPAYWPASGAIKVESLFAKYSEDGPFVLRNITFDIKSGERVGIVGRTGSGKSSLALSLLRLIPVEGKVYLDGRLTDDLNLDALRNNVAIIPQDPTLLSGTLRFNLDPFSQHDDAKLYDALRATGLITDSEASDDTNLGLDNMVANAGSNFSVGQRQLIALARSILRRTRVLILDEATASVDTETDSTIQSRIRADLKNVTLITIAHRLHTIMDYDKIMVLDAGKLVELDTPLALLQNEKSYFRSLVEESGDKENIPGQGQPRVTQESTQAADPCSADLESCPAKARLRVIRVLPRRKCMGPYWQSRVSSYTADTSIDLLILVGNSVMSHGSPQYGDTASTEIRTKCALVDRDSYQVLVRKPAGSQDTDEMARRASEHRGAGSKPQAYHVVSSRCEKTMSQHCAGPSNLYASQSAHDTPIQPQLDSTPPYPHDVPPTPNRDCEAVPAQWFPIERGLSARGREKSPASGSWSDENASAREGVKADLRGDSRMEAEAGKQEEERKRKERKQLLDIAGEVEKVVRKVYHLSEPGIDKERERDREDDASTTAVARSEQERETISKAEDDTQNQTHSHVSQQGDTCDFRKVAILSASPHFHKSAEAKQQAIRAWISDVHAQTGGKAGLAVPVWATKVGAAPSDTENSYEETLVGDEFNYPTKLPDDENPEDEVERISLTAEIPMGAYIAELVRRTSVGISQLKIAACYLIALNPTIQALLDAKKKAATVIATGISLDNYIVSPLLCARRTLVACLIIASKFLGDNVYTMKAWSRITGLEAPDLVQCESAIGVALGWRMWVGANVQNLKNDVFIRTLAQLKAPIPRPPPLVVPQMSVLPQPSMQDLRTALPTVPAAHAAEPKVEPAPSETIITRKRSRAVLSAGPGNGAEVRAQKRKAIERFSMPRSNVTGCATSMVMPEQVDEPRPMAEAY